MYERMTKWLHYIVSIEKIRKPEERKV